METHNGFPTTTEETDSLTEKIDVLKASESDHPVISEISEKGRADILTTLQPDLTSEIQFKTGEQVDKILPSLEAKHRNNRGIRPKLVKNGKIPQKQRIRIPQKPSRKIIG